MFYGTNRARAPDCTQLQSVTWNAPGSCRPNGFYGRSPARVDAARHDELEVGTFKVALPPGHERGIIERPLTIFTVDLRKEDPTKDVVISELSSYGSDYEAWVREVQSTGKHDAFIYVHGYATTFADAARRAGQVAFDLDLDVDFGGLPMLYSWPSRGTTAGYLLDYDTSLDATESFNHFLDLVKRRAGVSRVHVIAHSMGNWLVANALRERALKGDAEQLLDQLVLAAPDIWADRFRDRFLTTLPRLARRVTLYLSDNDRALKASAELRARTPRAGLLAGGLMGDTTPGFDVVDATELPADFLDHSYYASNRSMLADMYCLLKGRPADGRPLILAIGLNWRFRTLSELASPSLRADACGLDGTAVKAAAPATPAERTQSTPAPFRLRLVWLAGTIALIAVTIIVLVRRRRRTP